MDTDSRNLVVNAWGKHLRKAYGDFGSRSSPPQTAKRKQLKGETWIKVSLQPHEIEQSPNDVVAHLTRENRELDTSLEAKAADLYRHMCDTHSGKDFTEVGKRQRQRHDTNTVSWLLFLHRRFT